MPFLNDRPTAVQLLSSSVCNANCTYCFIPKVPSLKDFLPEIKSKVSLDGYVADLKRLYGDRLTSIGLWGTEPLTTLKNWEPIMPDLLKEFPKLTDLHFSTNMFLSPDIIASFISSIPKNKEGLVLSIQISIDGPPEITDKNRGENATRKITSHFLSLLQKLNGMDLGKMKVRFLFKSTLDMEDVKWFAESASRLWGYFFFFDMLIEDAKNTNKNKNVELHLISCPTIAVPGTYTTEDGFIAAKFFRNLKYIEVDNYHRKIFKNIQGDLNIYENRYKNLFEYGSEYFEKSCMFTCSGGDSNFQIDTKNNLHICHRTSFYDNEEFIKVLAEVHQGYTTTQRSTLSLLKNLKKNYIIDSNNQAEINRFLYICSNYHDNGMARIHLSLPTIYELAYSSQISKVYLDKPMAMLFAHFCHTALSCPAENIATNGSIYLPPIGVYRLFGNGAFEDIFRNVMGELESEYIK